MCRTRLTDGENFLNALMAQLNRITQPVINNDIYRVIPEIHFAFIRLSSPEDPQVAKDPSPANLSTAYAAYLRT